MENAARPAPRAARRATHGSVGLASVLAMGFAICLAPIGGGANAHGDEERSESLVPLAEAETRRGSEELPFKDVKLIIEHNATAEDTGFQVFLDGDPWKSLMIEGPDGRSLLEVRPRGPLKTLGLTEFFFETNEPPNAEVPIEELLARFPEGAYEFEGRSVEGVEMAGTATLTHAIPKGPRILSPAEGEVVDPNNTVVRWEPVTESITGSPVEIVSYEVIVTKPVIVSPPGFSKPVLSVHVSGAITSLTVPPEFFEPGTAYEFEVLALEVGGNQTISSSSFSTK